MKKLVPVLGVTLIVLVAAAIYLWRDLDLQREQNTTALARVTALESAHSNGSTVAQQVADRAQAAALNPAAAAQAGPAPAAPAAGNQSAARKDNPLRAQMEQLQNNPQFQEMQRMMLRQMLEQEYPDVAKEFNLSKEQAGKLLDLLAKKQMDEAAEFMGPQRGGTQDRAAREEQMRLRQAKAVERERAFETELKTLLGNDYKKWDAYESAAAQRQQEEYALEQKEELRHSITAGSAPLSDVQFEQLNAALTAEQKRIDQESARLSGQQQRQRMPENNRRLAAAAAAHLNPQQLESYKRFLQERQEMMSSVEAMGVFSDE